MSLPSFALDLRKLMYNNSTSSNPTWYDVQYVSFEEFIRMNGQLNETDSDTGTMTVTNDNSQVFTFKYRTDVVPNFYTSFNDNTLIFDSYDSSTSTTLVGARTMCWGGVVPEFIMEDNAYPDLDPRQFQLLLQASKAQAFVEMKQIENPKAEKKERRNEINAQRTKHAIDQGANSRYRGYGRK